MPGAYLLEVYNTDNGCHSVDLVQVFQSDVIPRIIFPNTIFPCQQDSFRLTSFVDPPDGIFSYTWSGSGIIGNTDSAFVSINSPGVYILTVTDLTGNCTTIDTAFVIEQNCEPCLTLVEPASLTCTNGTAILEVSFCEPCTGCTLQWTTNGSGILISGEQTLTPLVGAAGIYTLVATDTLGFQATLNVTVTAATNPVADAGQDRLITCDSLSVTLGSFNTPAGADIVYQWSAIGSGVPSPDNERFTSVNVPDNYVLEVLNLQTGCSATDTVLVGINQITPLAEAGPDAEITCSQPLVVLNGTGSTLGSNITYSWTTGTSGCIQGAATLNPIVSCPGIYRILVRNTLNGCTAIDSVLVENENVLPPLLAIPDTSLTCTRTEVLLTGNAPDLTGYTTQWCILDASNNVVPGSCMPGLEFLATQPGRYRFTLQNDTTGCIAIRNVTVLDARQIPAVEAGTSATLFCTQDSLILSGSADPNLEYQWSAFGGSLINNAQTLSPTIYQPDTYVLQVTNVLTNCVARDTVVILQDLNAPSGSIGLPDTLNCTVNAVTLSGQGTTASGNIVWEWATNEGNILSGAATPTPVVNQRGFYFLTIKDPVNNCTASDTVFVEENRFSPNISLAGFPGLQLTCTEDTLTFDASGSASATGMPLSFQWDVIALGNLIGNPTASIVQADRVGTYRLIVTDVSNTCRDTLTVPLGASITTPVAVVAPPLPLGCADTETTLNATGSSEGPQFRYEWRDPAGNLLPQTGLLLQASEPGTYSFTVFNTNNGCQSEALVTVIENQTLPFAVAEAEGLLDCETQEVLLDGSNSSTGPQYVYTWSTTVGVILSPVNEIAVNVGAAGPYVLTVRDVLNGCEAKDTVQAEAVGNFISGATLSLLPQACDGQNGGTIVVESIQGGTEPFFFALNSTIFTATQTFRYLLPGEYRLQIQDANGCEWDTLLTMPELMPPTVDLGPDINMELGDTIRIEALVNAPYESLLWSPSSAFADPTVPVQRVSPSETMAFTVVVRDEFGCVGSDDILITVSKPSPVFIPDAFSPNGDGQNDVLMIFGGKGVRTIEAFNIFDRWGNLVFGQRQFQPNDPAFGWDGNFEGRPMNAAVYVYYAEVVLENGEVIPLKGDIILMR
ncbi:MAG: gliding motility-associated C-terminal domain-containing protein [Saprospiraceae bacterium]|nr:gliding motility-associated C-terminal domain-containing protein [Saprospiraceae bacterium]